MRGEGGGYHHWRMRQREGFADRQTTTFHYYVLTAESYTNRTKRRKK